MKTLLLMRHGKSSWRDVNVPDHDRPLKRKGKSDAPLMGRFLGGQDLVPQLIVASTAKRARKTAKLVAKACDYEGQIVLEHELYHAGPMGYIRVLRGLDESVGRVLIVGHNPGLEVLLEVLTGDSEWLPTAALARIELPVESWSEVKEYIGGTLVALWTPKTVKASSR